MYFLQEDNGLAIDFTKILATIQRNY